MFCFPFLAEAGVESESIWMTARRFAGASRPSLRLHTPSHLLAARPMSVMMPKQGEQRRKPEPVTFANCSGLRGDEISHSPGRGGACYPSDESRCPYLGNISRSWQLQGPSIISREKEAPPESNFQPGTVSRVGRVSLPQSDQPGLGE